MRKYLFCLLTALFAVSAGAYELKRVSVHDPSIVWEPTSKTYYIFGSHRACAKTTDLMSWTEFSSPWQTSASNNAPNSTAFTTPAVKKVKKGGAEVDFPAFNAINWSARGGASYSVDGNMWAPDVIWNPSMKKWCQYLSINGDNWYSSIILLTSDNIEGPYLYQGPVVISGFYDGTSYKDTDLELVLGSLSALPDRYATGDKWGDRYPNNIDPCVFYDEKGKRLVQATVSLSIPILARRLQVAIMSLARLHTSSISVATISSSCPTVSCQMTVAIRCACSVQRILTDHMRMPAVQVLFSRVIR